VYKLTDNQYKIFKAVRKYRTLPKILTATGISDYLTLQEDAGVGMLDFSDCEMDEKTIVTLTNPAAEAYEERHRYDWKELRAWVTFAIAVWGALTGTITLFLK
jgi:hypothetical protein